MPEKHILAENLRKLAAEVIRSDLVVPVVKLPTPPSSGKPLREIWTAKEVAAYLRISKQTVTNLAKRRQIPGKQIGNLWRFYRDDIENLV